MLKPNQTHFGRKTGMGWFYSWLFCKIPTHWCWCHCTPVICLYHSYVTANCHEMKSNKTCICYTTLKFPNSLKLFGEIWTQGTIRHILGPVLVIFEICHFLTIPEPFEWVLFRKWVLSENQFSRWRSDCYPSPFWFSFRRTGPRLNHGPIWFPVQTHRGCYGLLKVDYPLLGG